MAGSANQDIVIYSIVDHGNNLKPFLRFRSDNSLKQPTLVYFYLFKNSLHWKSNCLILASGGDDCIARVFEI